MKAFLSIGNELFLNYDVVANYGYNNNFPDAKFIVSTRTDNIKKIVNGIRSGFTPKKGDEIFLLPPAEYAMDDIRRNYKIRRKVDTGVCNVISLASFKGKDWYFFNRIFCNRTKKQIVIDRGSSEIPSLTIVEQVWGHGTTDDIFIGTNETVPSWDREYSAHNSDALFAILSGLATKPCITYDDLDLNSDTELNLDTLMLVYRLGKEQNYKDSREKLRIEMLSMNNQNWRLYPGTMSLLYWTQMFKYTAFSAFRKSPSTCPKPIQEMLELGRTHKGGMANEKDLELGQKFIAEIFGIKIDEPMFLDYSKLYEKAKKYAIPPSILSSLFGCVTKVKPLTYEQYKSSLSSRP